MDVYQNLIQAILVIVALYILALILRWRKVLAEGHSLVLARIVTDLFLPAVVFVTLAGKSIRLEQLSPALVMLSHLPPIRGAECGLLSLTRRHVHKTEVLAHI